MISEAYPNTMAWLQEDGLWLQTHSMLLPNHWHEVVFVTAFSCRWPYLVKSWGFWTGGLMNEPVWIGPRHTNFPDGSICAFEPSDSTWTPSHAIVTLLDIYTLWAVRHLHLKAFEKWPGQQYIVHPYERLTEQREDELCGCGRYEKKYFECCREADLNRDRVGDAVNFLFYTEHTIRQPPESITRFVREQATPPTISSIL